MKYLSVAVIFVASVAHAAMPIEEVAPSRVESLRLSTYMTAGEVVALDLSPDGFEVVVQKLKSLGITRVFLEVYRGEVTVPIERLVEVRDEFESAGFEIYGGIATVPGGDVGVHQDGPLGWFNWQHEKTQRDLAEVMRNAAPVFHHFIVDDFLCTGDVSEASKLAKGDREWSEYRRELMTRVAREVLVEPAQEANPDITMIIKFPQWYDLFHRHGYDVANMPPIFDEVYVGTETRGARTRRYGFVQPYEGFVNFRWLSAIAGDKTGGAWFDHGDTAEHDFVEQAFQSVIAGANEIVMFHFGAIMEGHPDHARLVEAFPVLADLADAVDKEPVWGVSAYKPPNSDAGQDVEVINSLGMLGIPLVPTPTFPTDAGVVFLPTQAAADTSLQSNIESWLGEDRTLVMTAGLLRHAPDGVREYLHEIAGLKNDDVAWTTKQATHLVLDDAPELLEYKLSVDHPLTPAGADVLVAATVEKQVEPYLTLHTANGARVYVLNLYTFTQADFDAVNEVLLAPRDLGLFYLPQPFADVLRNVFLAPLGLEVHAPPRVTFQPFGNQVMIYNYNDEDVDVSVQHGEQKLEQHVPARGYYLGRIFDEH